MIGFNRAFSRAVFFNFEKSTVIDCSSLFASMRIALVLTLLLLDGLIIAIFRLLNESLQLRKAFVKTISCSQQRPLLRQFWDIENAVSITTIADHKIFSFFLCVEEGTLNRWYAIPNRV